MNPGIDPSVAANLQTVQNSSIGSNSNTPTTSQLGQLGQAQQLLNSQQTTQPVQAPKNQPSTIERLLPTIGAVGLPVLADLLTGGLALPADVALAGAGGGLGKAAENAATGQKVLQGNDLVSAAEGAAGQGIGAGLGSLIAKGGDALAGAGQSAAQAAEESAAKQAALDESDRIGAEFGSVKPGAANVGSAISKAQSLGFDTPTAQELDSIGKIYTNGNLETTGGGVLNSFKNGVLNQAGGNVDLNDLVDSVKDTVTSGKNPLLLGGIEPVTTVRGGLPMAPNNVATNMIQQVRDMLPEATTDANGVITQSATPQEAQELLKGIGSKIDETMPQPNVMGTLDPADVAENNAWRQVYGNVRQALYNRPEVDQMVSNTTVSPEMEQEIDGVIKKFGSNFTPEQMNAVKQDLISTINNSKTMDEVLQQESPMVNVGKVGSIQTQSDINNPQLPKSVRSAKSQLQTSAPQDNSLLGKIGGLKGASEIGGLYETVKGNPSTGIPLMALGMLSGNPAALSGVGGLLSKLGTSAIPGAVGATVATSPNTIAPPQGGSTIQPMTPGNNITMQALQEAMATPMLGGLSQLSTLLPLAQKMAAAEAQSQNLQNVFNQAGGAQGPIGGLLSQLGQTLTGGPGSLLGSNLQKQEQQTAQAIQAAGGTPGMMPQLTQNAPTAQAALSGINNLIQALGSGQPSGLASLMPTQ